MLLLFGFILRSSPHFHLTNSRSSSFLWVISNLWIPYTTIFPCPVGFQALNFTQVPLQSSCEDLRLKPHPLVNKLSIVTPLSQCFPIETKERASLQEMEGPTYEALFSKAIHGKEERSSPPTAKQGLSTANPRKFMPFGPSSDPQKFHHNLSPSCPFHYCTL